VCGMRCAVCGHAVVQSCSRAVMRSCGHVYCEECAVYGMGFKLKQHVAVD
jgi:transcription elongation factor Elf1